MPFLRIAMLGSTAFLMGISGRPLTWRIALAAMIMAPPCRERG